MFIRSERLFLRPGWPEDRAELLSQLCDAQVVRELTDGPWSRHFSDNGLITDVPQNDRYPHFFVTVPGAQGARLVGACWIAEGDGGLPELGFWFARDEWGKGYATEAVSAVLRLARTLGHREVMARMFVDSPAADRVLRKVGFAPTGLVRPQYNIARGEDVPALVYRCCLGAPCNSDKAIDSDVDDESSARAA